jgi:hypothetical protein
MRYVADFALKSITPVPLNVIECDRLAEGSPVIAIVIDIDSSNATVVLASESSMAVDSDTFGLPPPWSPNTAIRTPRRTKSTISTVRTVVAEGSEPVLAGAASTVASAYPSSKRSPGGSAMPSLPYWIEVPLAARMRWAPV